MGSGATEYPCLGELSSPSSEFFFFVTAGEHVATFYF